jgi:hypothetical protein
MHCGKADARGARFWDTSMAALGASGRDDSARRRRRTLGFGLLLGLALMPADAGAEPIETEHLFGFTIGSDVAGAKSAY